MLVVFLNMLHKIKQLFVQGSSLCNYNGLYTFPLRLSGLCSFCIVQVEQMRMNGKVIAPRLSGYMLQINVRSKNVRLEFCPPNLSTQLTWSS